MCLGRFKCHRQLSVLGMVSVSFDRHRKSADFHLRRDSVQCTRILCSMWYIQIYWALLYCYAHSIMLNRPGFYRKKYAISIEEKKGILCTLCISSVCQLCRLHTEVSKRSFTLKFARTHFFQMLHLLSRKFLCFYSFLFKYSMKENFAIGVGWLFDRDYATETVIITTVYNLHTLYRCASEKLFFFSLS